MKRDRNKLSIDERTSFQVALQTDNDHVLPHTERNTCTIGLAFGLTLLALERLVRWGVQDQTRNEELEVHVYRLVGILVSEIWSVEALWAFPRTNLFSFSNGLNYRPRCVQIKTAIGSTFRRGNSERFKVHAYVIGL